MNINKSPPYLTDNVFQIVTRHTFVLCLPVINRDITGVQECALATHSSAVSEHACCWRPLICHSLIDMAPILSTVLAFWWESGLLFHIKGLLFQIISQYQLFKGKSKNLGDIR